MQRVSRAKVEADQQVVGEIGAGLVVLLGVGQGDDESDVRYMADKVTQLRIFPDDEGRMNRSLIDVEGQLLAISQFTLYGDVRKGRRPSFIAAADSDVGNSLYQKFVQFVRDLDVTVATGQFQANMQVELVNDGPVTILLDSRKLSRACKIESGVRNAKVCHAQTLHERATARLKKEQTEDRLEVVLKDLLQSCELNDWQNENYCSTLALAMYRWDKSGQQTAEWRKQIPEKYRLAIDEEIQQLKQGGV